MDDLQLNISVSKKDKKKVATSTNYNATEYKFLSKPNFSGKIIARKRQKNLVEANRNVLQNEEEPQKKVLRLSQSDNTVIVESNLRDLSENKGKYKEKNYQELNDEILTKQKPRKGVWISSLFKNNPAVPRIGQRAVKPIVEKIFSGKTFADLDLHPHSVANLQQNLGLKELMTVQQHTIPVILHGRDVLIRSQTGSGKTLAYALPVIEGLQAIRPKINRNDGIRVLVVVPTRELAVQTYELFVKLVKPFTWIVPGLLSGGQKRKAEKARLRKGLSILVGTPGRINDHLRHTKSLNFAKTSCLILDEADRLLDMGYEKDVAAIVAAIEDHKKAATYDPLQLVKQTLQKNDSSDDTKKSVRNIDDQEFDVKHDLTKVLLSNEKQTILLSATLTKAVENLAGITLLDPVFIDTSEGRATVADSLKVNKNNIQNLQTSVKDSEKIEEKIKNVKIPEDNKNEILNNVVIEKDNKQGLKPFNGSIYPDLFKVDNYYQTNKTKTDPVVLNDANANESDSDSDYEYFKVQKELEAKDFVVEKIEEVKPSLAGNIFKEAVKSAIAEDELVLPVTVNQTFLVVPMKLRLVTLCSLIVEHCVMNKKGGKMIIFMATLEMVDYHAKLIETVLTGKDIKVNKKKRDVVKNFKAIKRKVDGDEEDEAKSASSSTESEFEVDYEAPAEGGLVPVSLDMFSLHGSMPHEQRMEVFKQFRAARIGVLICTDVAARGLDVPKVDLVLQYCAPASATDYVHRVGRTGRAAQIGAAVLFLLPSEVEYVRYLEEKRIRLRQMDEARCLEPLRSVAPGAGRAGAAGAAGGAGGAGRAAAAVQARLEHVSHSSRDWTDSASRAYTSWVRFYSGYPRDVRQWLDARQLHLGHAAKAFALRDTPAVLARRAKVLSGLKQDKLSNRLTVHEEEEKKRPGFPKAKKIDFLNNKRISKQSSMHTASEFDSGLPPMEHSSKKKKKNK